MEFKRGEVSSHGVFFIILVSLEYTNKGPVRRMNVEDILDFHDGIDLHQPVYFSAIFTSQKVGRKILSFLIG